MARAKLTPKQLERFRQDLIDRLTALYRSVHQDVRDGMVEPVTSVQEDPRDEGDESLRAQIRDLRQSLDERDARLAQAMEEALRRIARGTYGICVDCGETIELERLRLVPWTQRCIDDQQRLEAETQERPPTL